MEREKRLPIESSPAFPPGLTCDQYYLYLASGYAYSFAHGIMYHTSQVPSEESIFTVRSPYPLPRGETAFWLSNSHYYDIEHQKWIKATFHEPTGVQQRIWREAPQHWSSARRFKERADDVTSMLNLMSLESPKPQNSSAVVKSRRLTQSTVRYRPCRCQTMEKENLRRVMMLENKHKNIRFHLRNKIKSLPPSLAQNKAFWSTVLM